MNKIKNNDFWKYLLGIGAGLGLGYLTYRSIFPKSKFNNSIDSLAITEAEQRYSLINDLKYNLYLRMRFNQDEFHQLKNQHRATVKGVVEIEFNLLEVRDLTMEFGGNILEFKKVGDKKPVKHTYDKELKKILIERTELVRGINKFLIHFSVDKCDKGIIFNEKVCY